jgi:hypothetical protein
MENAWSYQLKNGRIGTKKHIILHTLKTGREASYVAYPDITPENRCR